MGSTVVGESLRRQAVTQLAAHNFTKASLTRIGSSLPFDDIEPYSI